eukprot:13268543-Ditylum_brightwellii.AAC.1
MHTTTRWICRPGSFLDASSDSHLDNRKTDQDSNLGHRLTKAQLQFTSMVNQLTLGLCVLICLGRFMFSILDYGNVLPEIRTFLVA